MQLNTNQVDIRLDKNKTGLEYISRKGTFKKLDKNDLQRWKKIRVITTPQFTDVNAILQTLQLHIILIMCVMQDCKKSVGSQIVYELDHKKPVLYDIPIEHILRLGKLPVVPVGDTGTIPRHLRNVFPGAPGDRRPDAGDGCKMWFVNSLALGWCRDL